MMGGQYGFARHGECGMWMADVLPETASMADDICLVNSMWTDHPNHDNALYKIHSGRLFMGYPTLGAWTVYGLGSENQNLPRLRRPHRSSRPPEKRHPQLDVGIPAPHLSGNPLPPDGFANPQSEASVRTAE